MNKNFRYDINALRALAVSIVVIFHFFPGFITGGFLGVDVFFVISGFLMTKIIMSSLETNTFSLKDFYLARAKRIIPALAVMCLVVLLVGIIYLDPWALRKLGKHILTSVGFVSNHTYLKESGYFDVAAQSKWLLHTWSLSVEWQFYVLYPLVLMATYKLFGAKGAAVAIGTTLIGSLAYNYAYLGSSASYYTLPSRAWELLAGSVVALKRAPIELKKSNVQLLLLVAIASLFISPVLIDSSTLWPSHVTLIPVIATAIILLLNLDLNFTFHKSRLIQWVGLCSYSIYLWHWPINVFIKNLTSNTITHNIVGVMISVLMGILSFKFIESYRPKKARKGASFFVAYYPVVFAIPVALIGQVVYESEGLLWRLDKTQLVIAQSVYERNPRSGECHVEFGPSPECHYGSGPVSAIVLGDSHGASIVRSVEASAPNDTSVIDWTRSACPTISGIKRVLSSGELSEECGDFVSASLIKAKTNYPNVPVVVINRMGGYLYGSNEDGWQSENEKISLIAGDKRFQTRSEEYLNSILSSFEKTMCELSQSNPVYLVKPIPELKKDVPKTMYKYSILNQSDISVSIPLEEYRQRTALITKSYEKISQNCRVTLIDPEPIFCDDQQCLGDINNHPTYVDDDHLNEFGAGQLIPQFREKIWGQSAP
ncbi:MULTISPECIES: acyltransferase family protein [Vibrio]|uniref:Acyltransferase n=4 Tax=Vibrio TaxID=662 RepID=A0A2N7NKW9_9VIBR|nr:acyltransferase family protein [Vibrio tasmaniensis]PMP15678.1 acyltransferase [Vibrio tasmaniensis]TKG31398.1 acyltransferase [Vibrio tasmaniensis]TKG38376.1 acyltransferase [Vibrio tasmaniensis]TKG46939.1 acyltransferase [Vibrio tasmaniensis]TKG47972.1 acyltransferase [Vibrio tasmaniensis]